MVGIYKITNLINGHSYIGQSVCITERWNNHRCAAREGIDYPLYRAMRKYGLDNFSFEIIEECPQELLNEREKYWISYYNTYYDGYNQTLGGQGASVVNPKITEIKQELKQFNLTIKQIADKYNLSPQQLAAINNGRAHFDENESYPIRKNVFQVATYINKHGDGAPNHCIDCNRQISKGATRCSECSHRHQSKADRPNPIILAQEILSMGFCAVGRKYDVSDNAIRKWCKAYDMPTKKPEMQKWLNQQLDITTSNDV